MRVIPLDSQHPGCTRDALVRRGLDPARADAAARGLVPVSLMFDEVGLQERQRISDAARAHGMECLTGDNWALLSAAISRVAGSCRPGASRLGAELTGPMGQLLAKLFREPATWQTHRGSIPLERPVVMGILNVTPDSFSDGGLFLRPDRAVAHAEEMLEGGASILDVGGESSAPGRPGEVPPDEEWRRLEPVVTELSRRFPGVPLSVDTRREAIARRALDAGAWIVNDVSGLRHDPTIADVCAAQGAGLVLMHSRGAFAEMATYQHAQYTDVAVDVLTELGAAATLAETRGVSPEAIVVDPGLGFAKRPEHNYVILNRLPAFASLGFPVMIGPSRKRFLGWQDGRDVSRLDHATAAACVAAYGLGATIFRVHAAALVGEALEVAHAVRSG